MSSHRVEIRPDDAALAADVAAATADQIRACAADGRRAHIVVTGGGIGTAVLSALVAEPIDWGTVDVWWGDERFLPEGHPDRNETQARAALLDHVNIPSDQVHPMPADNGQGAEAAALAYADELAQHSADGFVPAFDVLMLGVGPEGHVASIFPDSPAARAGGSVVAVHNSPKPPPTRVSLTFPAIRSAREVWLVAAGAAKADAIAAALAPGTNPVDVPVAGALGAVETVAWLDEASASKIAN